MDLRIREWGRLAYSDPEVVLPALRQIELDPRLDALPEDVRRLRTGPLKEVREARLATLFCWGMSHVMGAKVLVAPGEGGDYDFVAAWPHGDTLNYTPIQLKELPPEDRNPDITLMALAAGLSKYAQTDTALAIYLNCRGTVPLDELTLRDTPFSEVWYFWCGDELPDRWFIWGKPLWAKGPLEFGYPG